MAAPKPEGFTSAGEDFTVLNRQVGSRSNTRAFAASGYKPGDPFCGPDPADDLEAEDQMED